LETVVFWVFVLTYLFYSLSLQHTYMYLNIEEKCVHASFLCGTAYEQYPTTFKAY